MNTKHSLILFAAAVCLIWFGALASRADTHYVWRDNPSPVSPFTNGWASASTQIQLAVDQAGASDTVLVTNGTYDTGTGLSNPGAGYLSSNRVYVSAAITIRSVNGPAVTIIKGGPDPATLTYGSNAVRCVSLWGAASLIGFTLNNGYSSIGDSSWQRVAGGLWLNADGAVASNCVIVGNYSAWTGGGVKFAGGTLANCIVSSNTALGYGGGIDCTGSGSCAINDCTISSNYSGASGGGVFFQGTTYKPTTLMKNCTIDRNYAVANGGGVQIHYTDGTVRNCLIVSNRADNICGGVKLSEGGGTGSGVLENSTVVGNTGGGVRIDVIGKVTNCIVWGNGSWNFSIVAGGTVSYTCSDPVISGGFAGAGNTGADPQFVNTNAGNYRLGANSPCINTGFNQDWMTNSVDMDGKIRIRYRTVDMGAYEAIYKGTVFTVF